MMDGPSHYREAERLLSAAAHWTSDPEKDAHAMPLKPGRHEALVSEAQVHATLALAAATAEPSVQRFYGEEVSDSDWARAVT